MVECLIGYAAIAIANGLPGAGARLLAAATAASAQHVAPAWPATRNEYAHNVGLAATRLTAAELRAEEAAGRALSLEQAVAYAQHLPLKSGPTSTARSGPDDLTEREREVATLIATGRSNGEIAAELVLSKRTVEKHISSILSKLTLTHRAQVVRWAIEHGLTGAAA